MKRIVALVCAVLAFSLVSSPAAELGRVPVKQTAKEKDQTVPVIKDYGGAMSETGPGFDVMLTWNSMDWKIDGEKFSDQNWGPRASFTYGIGTMFDLRFTAKYMQGSDKNVDLSAIRLGVGTRAWIKLQSDFQPYVGGHVNYDLVDVEQGDSNEGLFSVEGEVGLAYLINEFWAVHVQAFYEAGVTKGSTEIGGEEGDVELSVMGVGIGFNVVF